MSAYYAALIKDQKFAAVRNGESIKAFTSTHSQFHYGYVTYNDFSIEYSDRDWCGRKVIALPAALWSASIKTIYHLCCLFVDLVQTLHGGADREIGYQAAFQGQLEIIHGTMTSLKKDGQLTTHCTEKLLVSARDSGEVVYKAIDATSI